MYALHLVRRGCTTHVSMSCIDVTNNQNSVLGTVVVVTSWEEDVCQVLANWHSCSNTITGTGALVVDEVGPFSVVPDQKVVGGIPLFVLRMDLAWLHNLFRRVSYSHFFQLEPFGVVDYLRICLESVRNPKILKKIPGLNAVSNNCGVFFAWLNCTVYNDGEMNRGV